MTVHLVGAGPGDPELLTVKAARLISQGDVVVHDRLVGPGILEMVAPWAEVVDVGKDPQGRRTTQQEINAILIDRGRSAECVVRLKGGDPFVFGRGGEEVDALSAAGIDVEVVPGISSVLAAPAAAGVALTHRRISSAFTVITGHQDPANDPLSWQALADLGSTLVVLMGARRAASIRDRLIESGMGAATPVAVIYRASTPDQRVWRITLSSLGETPIPNPAVIVIGDVAASASTDELASWTVNAGVNPALNSIYPTQAARDRASVALTNATGAQR